VLDSCEHVVDAVANIVERVREAAPGVHILGDQREPLRVAGERLYRLLPLGRFHRPRLGSELRKPRPFRPSNSLSNGRPPYRAAAAPDARHDSRLELPIAPRIRA